jgi:carboxymethylenebutenolidase
MSAEITPASDAIGTKPTPFSRCPFMTASAAVAAGDTLAAGSVRAEAVKTDTVGIGSR